MPRRIDVELTSHADGAWTWRAVGARQPKGTVAEGLLPGSASVGDVLRAEIETGLDGIEIVALSPPVKVEAPAGERIEVIGSPQRGPDVSVTLAPGSRRREGAARREGPPHRGASGRRPVGDRSGGPPRDRSGGPPRERSGGPPRERSGGPPRDRSGGPPRDRAGGPPRRDRNGAAPGDRNGAAPGDRNGAAPGDRSGAVRARERRTPTSTAHRNAMLAGLGPEQLPVAEQLLRGGIPAVRSAVADPKGPAANAERLLAIAEELLPTVNLASWKDRAAAAQAAGKELRLRDLRAVVTASRTVTLDDEGRELAKNLREALDQRVTAQREDWLARIRSAMEGGRVLDALRGASRPPDLSTRLPAEVAVAVAGAAGAAMTADVDPRTWLALLEAVVDSPVRRTVKPAGIPGAPEAQEGARRAAGLVPELAKLLGLRIPPPPPPPRRLRVSAGGGAGPGAAP